MFFSLPAPPARYYENTEAHFAYQSVNIYNQPTL